MKIPKKLLAPEVLEKNLVPVATTKGLTYKNHPISIIRFENGRDGEQCQFLIAFSGDKPVASVRIQGQSGLIASLEASGIRDRAIMDELIPCAQARRRVNLGEYAGRGILPALHAYALEYLINNHPQVTEAYRNVNFENPGWLKKLNELGAVFQKYRMFGDEHKELNQLSWDLEKLRVERPWKKFLLRESK